MKIYFATQIDKIQKQGLDKIGQKNRLLSFYDLKKKPKNALKDYVGVKKVEEVE